MRARFTALPLTAALVFAPVVFGTSGCACGTNTAAATSNSSGGCSGSGSVQSCSPSAENANEFGKIGVQQAGPQKPIAWGVYPKVSFGTMTVQITIGGTNVHGPITKSYPQHGSFTTKSNPLSSGDVFRITGTWVTGKSSQEFYFQCTLA